MVISVSLSTLRNISTKAVNLYDIQFFSSTLLIRNSIILTVCIKMEKKKPTQTLNIALELMPKNTL